MVNQLKELLTMLAPLVPILAVFVFAAVMAVMVMRASTPPPKKSRVIRTYAKRVGKLLRDRYRQQEQYTPAQVKKILKERRYSTRYDCYALAMYCSENDFVDYHRTMGEPCNYNSMRSEICDYLNLG